MHVGQRLDEKLALGLVDLGEGVDEHLGDGLVQDALRHHLDKGIFLASHIALDSVEFEQSRLKYFDELFHTFDDKIFYLLGCVY